VWGDVVEVDHVALSKMRSSVPALMTAPVNLSDRTAASSTAFADRGDMPTRGCENGWDPDISRDRARRGGDFKAGIVNVWSSKRLRN
jgi:hypothetical protein